MKTKLLCVLAMSSILVACGKSGTQEPGKVTLDSEKEKVSYSIGVNFGSRIGDSVDLDVDAFSAGLRDAVEGNEWRMTEDEVVSTLQNYQQKQMKEQQAKMKELAEKNKQESETFLAENAKKEGVVTTESGLQYKVLKEGTGEKPQSDDEVKVHYSGTLVDGTEFDSSYKRGEPVTLPVDGVIPGWTEALQLMREGAKWRLFIPADLAYGPGGTNGVIGPNAALVFDVELIEIVDDSGEKGEKAAQDQQAAPDKASKG